MPRQTENEATANSANCLNAVSFIKVNKEKDFHSHHKIKVTKGVEIAVIKIGVAVE